MKRLAVLASGAAVLSLTAAMLTSSAALAAPQATALTAPSLGQLAAPRVTGISPHGFMATWKDADPNGTIGITGYRVTTKIGATRVHLSEIAPYETSVRVRGLRWGSTYRVVVQAERGAQLSKPSDPGTLTFRAPKRPAKPTASASSASKILVRWTTPGSAGGPAVQRYQVRVYRSGHLVKSGVVGWWRHSLYVTGLSPSTSYTVGVTAANSVAWSALSHLRGVTTKRPSAVQRWAASKYGTFAQRTYSGTGDSVITLPAGAKAGIVSSATNGKSNFVIETLDSSNNMDELLVNEIGAVRKTDAYGLESWSAPRRLQITADGDWTITLRPISSAGSLKGGHSGDGVFLYGGGSAVARFTNSGAHNFIVWQYDSSDWPSNLLINEIGRYSGSQPLHAGPSVVTVQSSGYWTATIQ